MFGFLKDKLKEWVDKAKDKIKPAEEIEEEIKEEVKEDIKKESKEKKTSSEKKDIKEKPKKEKVTKKVDKIIEEAKTEEIKEVPLKFEPGLQKYEPNIEEISQKKQDVALASKELHSKHPPAQLDKIEIKDSTKELKQTEPTKEEIKKEIEEIKKEVSKESDILTEKPEEKKKGFLSKLFGKKSKVEDTEEEISVEELEKKEIIEPELKIETKKESAVEIDSEKKDEKKTFFSKLKSALIYKISEDDFNSLFDDLEMLLLENNVALEVVEDIKKKLSEKLIGKEIKKDDLDNVIKKELKNSLNEILIDPDDPIDAISFKKDKPFVILFFGINGTGKTTSIAKMAYALKNKGYKVALAAADTFRAASIEQIQEHANRLEIPLIKHDYGADPAAVGFDAIKYARAHNIDAVLIDTAGRMHTKSNLIAEMEKIVRVTNPDLKIFVAESIAGNDATEQAKTFHESINIDGAILSKADIDEKGGTIISVSHAIGKPIFYLGTGQNYSDLKLFNKQEFVDSLGL